MLLYTCIVHHAVLFALLLLLSPYGVVGIAWAVVVPVVVSAVIAFVLVVRYLDTTYRFVLGPVVRSALAALVMYACTSPEYSGQEGAFVKRRFMVLA